VNQDLVSREAELRALRERLTHAAEGIAGDDSDDGELNSAAGDQHLADHAGEMVDREIDETLEENADHVVQEIDLALQQIADGTYGTCAVCGAPIPAERLEAIPYATLCIEDKRLKERG
jgi:RNA polymerase-binding transcription factor DksA